MTATEDKKYAVWCEKLKGDLIEEKNGQEFEKFKNSLISKVIIEGTGVYYATREEINFQKNER